MLLLRAELAALKDLLPEPVQTSLCDFRLRLEAGEFTAAADVLCNGLWQSLPQGSARQQCLGQWLASAVDPDLSERVLLHLLSLEQDQPMVLVALAQHALSRERHDEVFDRLEQAEAHGTLSRDAQALRIKALTEATVWTERFDRALDDALRGAPDVRRLYTLKQDVHEKRGERAPARATLDLARSLFPDDSWLALRAFHAALADKRSDNAARLFSGEIWPSSLPEGTRRGALSTMVRDWQNPESLAAFLESLLRDIPDDRFILVKLATLSTRGRNHVEAARYLEQARQHGPLPAEAEAMQVNMLLVGGDATASLALAKRQLAERPDRKDLARRANLVASICGSEEDVVDTMRHAIMRWPDDATVLQRYNRAVLPEVEDQRLFEHLAGLERSDALDGRWFYQFALACLRRSETPRAHEVLSKLVEDALVGPQAQRMLNVLDLKPAAEWDALARFTNDSTVEIRVVEKQAAKATLVVMAGLHGGLGSLPLSHLDALLQEHPINVVYLRDNRWSAFSLGVPSLGPDEASTIAGLVELCARLGPMPMITFGGSLGGWSAMRYGALARARVAVSLAGPTRLAADDGRSVRFTQFYLSRMLPESAHDLLNILGDHRDLRILHVYGADNPKDRQNAARLEALPNATLIPLGDCDEHFVAAHLLSRGEFHPLIQRAISDAQAAS